MSVKRFAESKGACDAPAGFMAFGPAVNGFSQSLA
jgi:hypothetical protein